MHYFVKVQPWLTLAPAEEEIVSLDTELGRSFIVEAKNQNQAIARVVRDVVSIRKATAKELIKAGQDGETILNAEDLPPQRPPIPPREPHNKPPAPGTTQHPLPIDAPADPPNVAPMAPLAENESLPHDPSLHDPASCADARCDICLQAERDKAGVTGVSRPPYPSEENATIPGPGSSAPYDPDSNIPF